MRRDLAQAWVVLIPVLAVPAPTETPPCSRTSHPAFTAAPVAVRPSPWAYLQPHPFPSSSWKPFRICLLYFPQGLLSTLPRKDSVLFWVLALYLLLNYKLIHLCDLLHLHCTPVLYAHRCSKAHGMLTAFLFRGVSLGCRSATCVGPIPQGAFTPSSEDRELLTKETLLPSSTRIKR